MSSLSNIEATCDPEGWRRQWEAQRAERVAKAKKYHGDALAYYEAARPYKRSRSKVGQEQFAKYIRMGDTASAKAAAYLRGDEDAIARIEADNAAVDAVLGGGLDQRAIAREIGESDRDSYTREETERWLR